MSQENVERSGGPEGGRGDPRVLFDDGFRGRGWPGVSREGAGLLRAGWRPGEKGVEG